MSLKDQLVDFYFVSTEIGAGVVSDNESLHDFIVDDENDDYLKGKTSGASAEKNAAARGVTFSSAKAMQPVKALHPRFQSGSTSANGQRRYLGKIKRDSFIL